MATQVAYEQEYEPEVGRRLRPDPACRHADRVRVHARQLADTDCHRPSRHRGHAGQAIAVSGIFAVLTSLGTSSATRRIDRRLVLLSLTLLMMVSGVTVAFAPNANVFMAGRASRRDGHLRPRARIEGIAS